MKKILTVLISTFIAIIIFTTGKTFTVRMLLKNANFGILGLSSQSTDMLFLGSSLFRQGIDGRKLSTEDYTTYVLSYNGLQPYAEYMALQKVMENTEIQALVLDLYPYTLTTSAGMSDTRYIQGMPFSFIIALFNQMKEHGNADYYDLYEMAIQSNNEFFLTWPISYPLINSRYDRGSNLSNSSGVSDDELKLKAQRSNSPDYLDLDEYQLESLEKIICLCNEKNIKLVFLETPKSQYMYDRNTYVNCLHKYLEFLKDKNAEIIISSYSADRCLPDDRMITYNFDSSDSSCFLDLLHLSSRGRNVLSDKLKPILHKVLDNQVIDSAESLNR